MIIKDIPFKLPVRQSLLCWYYAKPVFVFRPARSLALPFCCLELFRRYSGISKLDAYQVRAARYLVRRRAALVCDWFGVYDGLMHAGGVV
ncbi:hypothetical protein HF285_04615 [Acidithiobacillus ferrooxidans F221]|nr:hypothetical protein [Acidithiobacillus ferrooxidans F221]